MATCTVSYSSEIARRAARAFFWRKWRTPFGIWILLSLLIVCAAIAFAYLYEGANWFVGAFGTLLTFNLIIQASYYFALPRALAKRFSNPALRTALVETSGEGVRVSIGPNASMLPWKTWKVVWIFPGFIILAVRPTILRFTFVPTDGMTADVLRDFEAAARGEAVT